MLDLEVADPAPSVIMHDLSKVGDSYLGNSDLEEFISRTKAHAPSDFMKAITTSGIVEAAAFPPSVVYPELIEKCVENYDKERRECRDGAGNLIFSFAPDAISKMLGIDTGENLVDLDVAKSLKYWAAKQDQLYKVINNTWLLERRERATRLPKKMMRSEFIPEVSDLITLLNRVIGRPQVDEFEDWMFAFILTIFKGVHRVPWADIISNVLHDAFLKFPEVKTFYLSSYIMYNFAMHRRFPGLKVVGDLDSGLPYQVYPELQEPTDSMFKLEDL